MIPPLTKLKQYYEAFDQASLKNLEHIYASDVVFVDPLHKINGVEALKKYFSGICSNLTYCQFTFTDEIVDETSACLKWQMEYSHASLKNNARLSLAGVSIVHFIDSKITSQEDFYDMGAMTYEHIPLLGSVIRVVKTRMIKAN
jgi:ketosteroid isomerase-like protein